MPSTIRDIRYYLPEKIYSNADFFADFPESRKSLERLGVDERHIIAPDQTASDLAFAAAEKFFDETGIKREDIDFLLLASMGQDYHMPATSCVLQERLGFRDSCGTMDIDIGCSAFGYGLAVAAGLIEVSDIRNVLLLTASSVTNTLDPKDKGSRYIFGDGAAATLISRSDKPGFGPFVFGTEGKNFDRIILRDGMARHPLNEESFITGEDPSSGFPRTPGYYFMDGPAVFTFSMRVVPKMVHDLLEKANLQLSDIDLFIFHQANAFMNEALRKKLGIAEEKFVHCLRHCGNTVQSTIPIAIYESQKNGRLKPGMKVLLAGFGVGLSWAGTIVQF